MSEIDYPALILPVATHFWGEPNKGLTTKIGARFGSQGSKSSQRHRCCHPERPKTIGTEPA